MMSNKMYNILKWVAMILLPAIGALYSALAGIWGFPYAEQIVGTITAVNVFLGTALTISTTKYNKMKVRKYFGTDGIRRIANIELSPELVYKVAQLVVDEKVETPEYVTVTINDEFVESGTFDTTVLKDGDTVEFLYFMGGGQ